MKLVPTASDVPVSLDGKPLRTEVSLCATDLTAGRILTLGRRIVLCLHTAYPTGHPLSTEDFRMLGHSDAIQAVLSAVLSVADLDVPVLIRGETGTGKELTAAAIAKASRRSGGPFVAINMATASPAR
jgi:two-component system, NtrC family, nitrogen regulation response regulator GlnG